MFLRPFVKADEKLAIWGQNFIKAYRLQSGVLPYHMGFAIQLDHRFGSKWMLNKLHHLGYSESYAETQNYKYCFLNDKNSMGFSDSSGTLNTIIEETDDQADAEVDIKPENLSASAAVAENETQSDFSFEIRDIIASSNCAVAQFVGDNIDLNIVSIYGNYSFHSMRLIKVTSSAPPSADDEHINRVKLKSIDNAKILKASETSRYSLRGCSLGSRVGNQSPEF